MLAMGIHPMVGCATSACMILFTSFTATTSFIVFGLLLPDYATVCLIVGFSATCVGQMSLSYLMKKLRRNSFIAFSIGIVVLLSAVLMTIQSLVSMSETKQHHFGGICGVSGESSETGWKVIPVLLICSILLVSVRREKWNEMERKLSVIDK